MSNAEQAALATATASVISLAPCSPYSVVIRPKNPSFPSIAPRDVWWSSSETLLYCPGSNWVNSRMLNSRLSFLSIFVIFVQQKGEWYEKLFKSHEPVPTFQLIKDCKHWNQAQEKRLTLTLKGGIDLTKPEALEAQVERRSKINPQQFDANRSISHAAMVPSWQLRSWSHQILPWPSHTL